MTWWALDIRCAGGDRMTIAAWLVEHTGQAVAEQGEDGLAACAASEADASALLAALAAEYPQVVGTSTARDDVDWSTSWRAGMGLRTIGRLTVAPSWIPTAGEGPCLVIDPEMAFGSGEHGSTRAALRLLDRAMRPGDRVLDLGSGSGILAIAAVLLGAERAVGIEVDEEAMPVADRNAERNAVQGQVTWISGDAALLAPLVGPAHLVLSNILREANTQLLPAIRAALVPGGLAVFSGMELPEAELFRPVLSAHGWSIVDEAEDEGWWAVTARC